MIIYELCIYLNDFVIKFEFSIHLGIHLLNK